MAEKYSFDYYRNREMKLSYKDLSRNQLEKKSEDIHEVMDEKIKLAEKFEEDKKLIEERIEIVYNSDLAYEDKREQLAMLKEMIKVLQDEYQEQVEKMVEKKQEEAKEIIEVIDKHRDTLKEQAKMMGDIQLKSGSVNLGKAIDLTNEIEQSFKELQDDENKQLNKRSRKIEEIRKQMGKDRSRTI